MTPAPRRSTASGSTDPLVQKRNANAKANAEYRASKKASKAELKDQQKDAKAQYKEQVRNAKINQKADKQTANNEMKLNSGRRRTPTDTAPTQALSAAVLITAAWRRAMPAAAALADFGPISFQTEVSHEHDPVHEDSCAPR